MTTTTNERPTPKVGDWIDFDGGRLGTLLCEDDGFSDSGFPGCEFRTEPRDGLHGGLAINVRVTGRTPRWNSSGQFWGWRVQVEFVGDCEPSSFVGGWMRSNSE